MIIEEAGAIVITKDRRILVLLTEPFWSFPKGRVEADEAPIVTAERELLEETSVAGRAQAFVTRFAFRHREQDYDLRLYRMSHVSGEPVALEHTNTEAHWLSIDEINRYTAYHPGYQTALRRALGSLVLSSGPAAVLEEDSRAAAAILGRPVCLWPLSRSWASRPLYRVENELLAIRRYENEVESSRIQRILETDNWLPIPRCIGRHDRWLMTTFIEGDVVEGTTGRSLLLAAGRLLAQVHDLPMPHLRIDEKEPEIRNTIRHKWHRCVDTLLYAGVIDRQQAAGIASSFAETRPAHLDIGITHWDFVPNNLVYTRTNELALIDFESSRLFATGYDLSKAVAVMGLSASDRARFLQGYSSIRSASSWLQNRQFYDLFFSVRNLANRLKRPYFSLSTPLERLLRLLDKATAQ